MNLMEEQLCEYKMDRICELFQQLAFAAMVSALEKIIERIEHFDPQTKQNNHDYQF